MVKMNLSSAVIGAVIAASLLVSCSRSREGNYSSPASQEEKAKSSDEAGSPAKNAGYVSESSQQSKPKSDSANGPSNGFMSSSAAVENKKDTVHRFIRTADMKFRVKNVFKATYAIENIAQKNDGFVTYTNLNSNLDNKSVIEISKDSSLETIYYTVENDLTLRVPYQKLDTTLKEIARLMDYLDYRIIKAEDVGLQLLANRMSVQRLTKHEERVTNAIDSKGKKLNETTGAEENLLEKQQEEDNARLRTLSLNDQINFSTVHLVVYQRPTTQREMIANEQNVEAYQPGMFTRIKEAIKSGWTIFEAIVVFIFNLWPLILIGLAAVVIFRKYYRKTNKGNK